MTELRDSCADLVHNCTQLLEALDKVQDWDTTRVGDCMDQVAATANRARAALEESTAGPSDEALEAMFGETLLRLPGNSLNRAAVEYARAVLDRFGAAQPRPVPASDQPGAVSYEFHVIDDETDEEPAWGTAATIEEAQKEGAHYWAMYSEDGPHRLEICRVEVLPAHALPLPEVMPDKYLPSDAGYEAGTMWTGHGVKSSPEVTK